MNASLARKMPKQTRKSKSPPVKVIGFSRRLVAALYDGFLLAILTFLLAFVIGFVGILIDIFNPDDVLPMEGIIILAGLVLSAIYYVGMWASSGETIGKKMAGIRVVRTDGSRLSWGRAFLRYLGYLLSGALLSLGFLWVVFDRRRQGLHDIIAGTFVVGDEAITPQPQGRILNVAPSDPGGTRWVWVGLWLLFAFVAPWGLLGGLWILGPAMSRTVTNIIQGLL